MTSAGVWSREIRSSYDDDLLDNNASYRERYATCSPTTRRRLITKVERRLSELRTNSESMADKLERAEKDLHELKLEESGERRSSTYPAYDDVSDDSLLSDDRGRRHRRDDREALRREIARLREDLRVLRRQTSPNARAYVADDDYASRRHVTNDYGYDSTGNYSGAHRRHYDDYAYQYNNSATVNDDLRQLRRSKTSFDDLDYNDYRYVSRPTSYCNSTGLRSCASRPVPTQHNRSYLMTSSPPSNYRWLDGFDTTAMRSYRPYGPADISIGDIVKFRRSGGKLERGRILYVGHLPGKSEAILGVELETSTGNHDGLHNGFRYFQCKPNRGLFVPFGHVVLAWSRT